MVLWHGLYSEHIKFELINSDWLALVILSSCWLAVNLQDNQSYGNVYEAISKPTERDV